MVMEEFPADLDVESILAEPSPEREYWQLWRLHSTRTFLVESRDRLRERDSDDPVVGHLSRELDQLPEISAVQALAANRWLVEALTGRRWQVMRAAREAGATWAEIGEALGMSKQGAQDWYRRKIEDQEKYVPTFHDGARARAVLDEAPSSTRRP